MYLCRVLLGLLGVRCIKKMLKFICFVFLFFEIMSGVIFSAPFSNWLFLNFSFLDCFNTFRLICALCFSCLHFWLFYLFVFFYNIIFINFHVATSNGFSELSDISRFLFLLCFLFFLCFSCVFLLRVSHYQNC